MSRGYDKITGGHEKPGAEEEGRATLGAAERVGNGDIVQGRLSSGLNLFSPREAAVAFSYRLLDEAACRQWVLQWLHREGARCPFCHVVIEDATTLNNFWSGRRGRCKRCGRKFTALSETALQGTHLEYRQILLMGALRDLMAVGRSNAHIAGILGVSADTVRLWRKKFETFDDER